MKKGASPYVYVNVYIVKLSKKEKLEKWIFA